MLNISLSLIGIVLIIYSLFIIKKDLLKDETKFEKLNAIEENVKNHYNSTNEIILSFNELVELKLEEINVDTKIKTDTPNIQTTDSINKNKKVPEINNFNKKIDPTHKKVMELLEIGLSEVEIAKRLNKGIREVEIIIKMYNK